MREKRTKRPGKKITGILLAILLIAGMLPLSATAEDSQVKFPIAGGTITFDKTSHDIIGSSGVSGELVIPQTIEGVPVDTIGRDAFHDNTALTSVKVPEGITEFGVSAFSGCTSLKTITLPSTMVLLDADSLARCKALEKIHIPAGTRVESAALSGSTGPVTVDSSNPYHCAKDGILYNKDGSTLMHCPSNKTTVVIPDNVETLDSAAFAEGVFKDIKLPQGLSQIGANAFSGCTHLTSIEIPDGVTTLESGTFSRCTALTNVELPSSLKSIRYWAFQNVESLASIEIPETVEIFGLGAFEGCKALTSFQFPNQVTAIPDAMFSGCKSLKTVTLPPALEEIGEEAFWGDILLDGLVLPSTLRSIGYAAFYDCQSLSALALPASIQTLGYRLFWNCDSLKTISIPEGIDHLGIEMFAQCSNLETVQLPGSIKKIDNYAFAGCGKLKNFQMPAGVTQLGAGAFQDCQQIKRLALPQGVTQILTSTFENCGTIQIQIPDSVTQIQDEAFFKTTPTIFGVSGSYAQQYAQANGFVFRAGTLPDDSTGGGNGGGGGGGGSEPDPEPEPGPAGPEIIQKVDPDGTVTTTTSWTDGKTAVAVKKPDGAKTISVTLPAGEKPVEMEIPSEPHEGKDFDDVPDGSWFKPSVDYTSGLGLFSGTGESTFGPHDPLTRGMLAATLYRLSGTPRYGTSENRFPDVKPGAWYADAANWAHASGVAAGTDSGFDPSGKITREQLVTMIYRYVGLVGMNTGASGQLENFSDAGTISGFAQEAMAWAVGEGMIQGSGGRIHPRDSATRAEVAAVLTRLVTFLAK